MVRQYVFDVKQNTTLVPQCGFNVKYYTGSSVWLQSETKEYTVVRQYGFNVKQNTTLVPQSGFIVKQNSTLVPNCGFNVKILHWFFIVVSTLN